MIDLPADESTEAVVSLESSVSSVLETTSDADWIRFDGDSGVAYWFHLNFTGGRDDSAELMRVRAPGAPILGFGAGFGEAVMTFTPTDESPVFVEILNSNALTASDDKQYTLTAHLVDDVSADTATDRVIEKGDAVLDLLEAPGDSDWFRLEVTAGESYELLLQSLESARNTTSLTIRDAAGAVLSRFEQGTHDIGRLFEATTSGTVYLDVGRMSAAELAGGFGYRLSVSDPGDTDPADATTGLTAVVGTPAEFRIDHAGDRDWVRVDLDVGQYYRVGFSGDSSFLGVDAVLRDASGAVVTANPTGGFGSATGGVYFLDVGLTDGSASNLSANLIETDDVPGTPGSLEMLQPGVTYTGDLKAGGDTDFIGFDVVAGFDYRIDVSFQGDYFGKTFSVMRGEESLQSVRPDLQKTGFLSHSADQTERLFVSIDDRGFNPNDTYSITLQQVANDAIAGSSLTTETIALNETVRADIDYGADRDWFRFSAEAGVIYEATVSGIGAANVGVRELDGTELSRPVGTFSVSATNYFAVGTDRDVFIDAGRYAQVDRTGSYSLKVEVSTDTILGTSETLTEIRPGETSQGRIDFHQDLDFHRFAAESGRAYAFVTEQTDETSSAQVWIFDDDGFRTSESSPKQGAPAVFLFEPSVSETIYIAPYVEPETDYSLTVIDVTDAQPGSAEDAVSLQVNQVTHATIDNGSDHDWFQLDVQEGQTYFAVLSGQSILTGEFSLRSGDGTVLQSIDVDPDADTTLQFTGGSDQFLTVEGLATSDANGFSVVVKPEVSGAFQDQTSPLFTGLSTGLSVDGSIDADGLRTITYKFADAFDEFDRVGSTSFRADRDWTDYEQTRIAATLELFTDTLNIEFSEVTGFADADITFFAAELNGTFSRSVFTNEGELGFAFLPFGGSLDGNTVFNVDGFGWDPNAATGDTFDGGLEQFGFGAQTVLHEVGHVLGLDHPFEGGDLSTLYPGIVDANGGGAADDVFNDAGSFGLSQSAYTVMSYVDGWTEHPFGTGNIFLSEQFFGIPSDPGGHIGTPMALDVAVLQTIYGANQSTNTGNDTYVLPDTQAQTTGYALIWDTGGTDTISYSGARDVVLDLRAATLEVEDGGGGFISFVNEAIPNDPVVGGFAIAHDVQIEVAESGSGDDLLTGNAGANTLVAGAGNDTLSGEGGENTLTGGTGADLFIIADATGNDTITDFALGEDLIDVQALELAFSQLAINEETGGTRIGYTTSANTGSILLQGLVQADVVESAFIISPTATGTSISGTAGNDNLNGTALDEEFFGLAGDDTLEGDAGDDLLFGGDGQGIGDQIIDFEIGVDTIDLSATGLGFGDLTITNTGSNATISYGTDTITVFNTTAAQLDQNQFEFAP